MNGVFQGGGVKGIAFVGALRVLADAKIHFKAVAGTSAGAIVAALYAAGYSADEMDELLREGAFKKHLGRRRMLPEFFVHKGIYKGTRFTDWIRALLAKKGISKFEDLKEIDLKIVAADVALREIIVFSKANNADFLICDAVRMSMSIPFLFDPCRYGSRLVVDGGIVSNFPVWLFRNDKEPTIGFRFVSNSKNKPPRAPSSFVAYAKAIYKTMMEASDKKDTNDSPLHIVEIDACDIRATKFNLSRKENRLLYGNGFVETHKYLTAHPDLNITSKAMVKFEAEGGGKQNRTLERTPSICAIWWDWFEETPGERNLSIVDIEYTDSEYVISGNEYNHNLKNVCFWRSTDVQRDGKLLAYYYEALHETKGRIRGYTKLLFEMTSDHSELKRYSGHFFNVEIGSPQKPYRLAGCRLTEDEMSAYDKKGLDGGSDRAARLIYRKYFMNT